MPRPVTEAQTVQAINMLLEGMDPPGPIIGNLQTNNESDPGWSCNDFGSLLLGRICEFTGAPADISGFEYKAGARNLPQSFADGTFVNISMFCQPSALNHNFNILVSGQTIYLIQTFIGQRVNIVRRLTHNDFFQYWHGLSNNNGWKLCYQRLFGVDPDGVAPPPQAAWFDYQYVTE